MSAYELPSCKISGEGLIKNAGFLHSDIQQRHLLDKLCHV